MKCDFHVHTHYSYDSLASPKEIVKTALSRGIDCLAITDHNETRGALEAIEFAQGKPILIIPGIEVKSKQGDILGLGIKKIIPPGLSAQETILEIKKAGGWVFIPHPFGFNCSFQGNLKDFINQIDGIEVFNASIFHSNNKKALSFAQKHNLAEICGSDAHSPFLLGRVFLEIPGKNLSIKQVFEKIKNKEGEIRGQEINFLEKVFDHSKRNIIKIKNYAIRKKRKV